MNTESLELEAKFLAGGGEMGRLTRAKEWESTRLGPVSAWPQSLRTTLSILLNSKFPMFLFWGTELTCFYNDAYRPSLGKEGKHPAILGIPAADAWPEIWPTIFPLIEQVISTGEAVWLEDQLIPIYRNGRLDDVYWTFSYSPVLDETQSVAGILVTCVETTEKVKAYHRLEESKDQLVFAIDAAELATFDYSPQTGKFTANERLKEWFGFSGEEEIELSAALSRISEIDRARVVDAINISLNESSATPFNESYTIGNPHSGKEKVVQAKGKVWFNDDHVAYRFNGTLQDITEQSRKSLQIEEVERRFRNTVKQAPVGIVILRGDDFVVEMANNTYLAIVDRNESQFVGKSLFAGLPEVRNDVEPVLRNVVSSGIPYHGREFPVTINRHGVAAQTYFDFVYQPLMEQDGSVSGVMVVATEVTATVTSKLVVADSEQRLRNLVMQSPVPITILKGNEFIVEMGNAVMLTDIWRKKPEEIIGRSLLDVFPELRSQKYPALLEAVYKTGVIHSEKESLAIVERDDGVKEFYLDFEYAPLREADDKVSGIIVTVNDVTEKVNARKKVEESERRFRLVADSAPVMIWMSATNESTSYFNTAWLQFTGLSAEEAVKINRFSLIHPDDRAECESLYELSLQAQKEFSHEYRLLRHDGEFRWVSDRGVPRLSDGKFEGFIGAAMDIHEKVIYQQKLLDDEVKLNIILDASELGTWEFDINAREASFSDRFLEIFGYAPGTILKHEDIVAHLLPEYLPIREQAFKTAFETGTLFYRARIRLDDGSVRWMEAKGKVFDDQHGNPGKLVGTLRDITQQQNYQEELERREEDFRRLAESMPQFVWMADASGKLHYFNQAVFSYSGLTHADLEERGWISIVHPDDRQENERRWTKSIETGEDFHYEHRFRRHDGEYRWQLSRAVAQRDVTGRIHMWVGTSTDIQEQKMFATEMERQVHERVNELKELNAALKKSDDRYHMMVEEIQDYAILYLSKTGVIENWNKGAETIKGYQANEIIGKNFSIFYPIENQKAGLPQKLLSTALTKGKAVHEGWRVRKDGSHFWASVVITSVHDEAGNVIGFSKVTHDLTEKKEADDMLKQNAAQLEQKNRELQMMNSELQSFAYVSSHDLQEPLRKIQVFAAMIMENEKQNLSDNGKDYFRRMQNAAARMQTLIEDLLSYSRTNITERNFETVHLKTLLDEVKSDLKEDIQHKHAVVEGKNLCEVSVIPFQFKQVLNNLIGNSLKFSKAGETPHIVLESKLIKGEETGLQGLTPKVTYCHLSVEDNGIGFDPQYKNRIFEVFQRLHGKAEYKGTGIGLAIVKKIMENHQGQITVESEVNKGTRFDLYFPLEM